jgi:hypothetical protein
MYLFECVKLCGPGCCTPYIFIVSPSRICNIKHFALDFLLASARKANVMTNAAILN